MMNCGFHHRSVTWGRAIASMMIPLTLSILFGSSQAIGEPSIRCVYDVLTGAYHIMNICGEVIDPDSEKRFVDLRSSMMHFINKNAQREQDKITQDYDEKRKKTLKRKGRAELCETTDYVLLKGALKHMLTPDQIAIIRRRLESPSDPSEGDCF